MGRTALGSSHATVAQAEKSMAFKDKDHDGTLSPTEVAESCDGVSAETIISWCEKLERASVVKRLYAVLDKNGDDKVVASEYLVFLRDALGSTATLEQAQKS